MERFPVELLYVLGFIAIVAYNYFAGRAARRRAQQEKAQGALPPIPPAPPSIAEELPEEIWGRTAVSPPPPAPAPVVVPRSAPPPPAPRRLHPVRALLRDRRGLRRAVVLMMVLGPCRAQEPPEG